MFSAGSLYFLTTSLFLLFIVLFFNVQFSKEGEGQFIGAAGSGANEAKIFDHAKGNSVVGIVTGLSRGIFALDFSPTDNRLAVAGGDSSIRIIDITTKAA